MKIYNPQTQIVRITITDQNTGLAMENIVKFSIAGSNCKEVCNLIENTFTNNLLPTIFGSRGICKNRSVKIDVSELDYSSVKMRKVNRTINLKRINAKEAGERLIKAVNEAELQSIIQKIKDLEGNK